MKKFKRGNEDDDDFEADNSFHVSCVEAEEGTRLFNIFLFGLIENERQFIPAIKALQVANDDDVVMIHLSTPGGDIDATDTFLHALSMCRAEQVIFQASGGVHSAGTFILMHADNVILSEGFNSLVHCGSLGHGGKYSDWKSSTAFAQRHFENQLRTAYTGFMTDEEIEAMIAGKDFWFDGADFAERLDRRAAFRAATEDEE